MLESMGSECDTIKQQQKLLWEQQEAMQERNHAWEISDFKNKVKGEGWGLDSETHPQAAELGGLQLILSWLGSLRGALQSV